MALCAKGGLPGVGVSLGVCWCSVPCEMLHVLCCPWQHLCPHSSGDLVSSIPFSTCAMGDMA